MKHFNIFQVIFLIILHNKAIAINLETLNLRNTGNNGFLKNKIDYNATEEFTIANSLNDMLLQSTEKTKKNSNITISSLSMNKILVTDDLMKTDKNDYQKKVIKRAIESRKVHKWKLPIKYQVKSNILKNGVRRTINYLKKETCIRFQKVKNVVGNGLIYNYRSSGCNSDVGMYPAKKPQEITLAKDCIDDSSILHETLHALGLEHQMSRKDRDKYITINKKNVIKGYYYNFAIEPNAKTYNLKYDYGSLMHYDRYAFSNIKKMTIISKNQQYLKTMGQTGKATFNDIKLVNLHYCNNICKKKLKCLNYGYTNPNNCNVCKCPTFFRGRFCSKLTKSQRNCPKQELFSTIKSKRLFIHGIKNCIIRITTSKGFKIKLKVVNSNFPSINICQPFSGLEIKFLRDKSVTGIRFCGIDKNKNIVSEGSTIIMHYRGFKKENRVNIEYRTVH